jgi:hypothetical protein
LISEQSGKKPIVRSAINICINRARKPGEEVNNKSGLNGRIYY